VRTKLLGLRETTEKGGPKKKKTKKKKSRTLPQKTLPSTIAPPHRREKWEEKGGKGKNVHSYQTEKKRIIG